jgi:hypothetical protein
MLLVISCGRVCIVNGIDTIICACRQEAGRKEGGSMGQASKARPWQKIARSYRESRLASQSLPISTPEFSRT